MAMPTDGTDAAGYGFAPASTSEPAPFEHSYQMPTASADEAAALLGSSEADPAFGNGHSTSSETPPSEDASAAAPLLPAYDSGSAEVGVPGAGEADSEFAPPPAPAEQ
jgi:hypothetical protein